MNKFVINVKILAAFAMVTFSFCAGAETGAGAVGYSARVEEGFDFRSENVIVTLPAAESARTLTVTVTNGLLGGVAKTIAREVSASAESVTQTFSFDDLQPARTYTWMVKVSADDETLDSQTGTFVTGTETGWFSASAASGESVVSKGAWAEKKVPQVADAKYVISDSTSFSPSQAAPGKVATVDFDIAFGFGMGAEDVENMPRVVAFAFTMLQEDALENDCRFAAIVGETVYRLGEAFKSNGEPVSRKIRAECDGADPMNKLIRFSTVANDGTATVLMPDKGGLAGGWIAVDTAIFDSIGFDGEGKVAGFTAKAVDTNVARTSDGTEYATLADVATGTEVTLKTNTRVDLANVKAGVVVNAGGHRLVWSDSATVYVKSENGKYVVKQYAGGKTAPANGIPSCVSDALGLDPENAAAVPLVVSEPNAAADAITLRMAVTQRVGTKVWYQLVEAETPDFANESVAQEKENDSVFTVPLPTEGAKVKYYKLMATVAR